MIGRRLGALVALLLVGCGGPNPTATPIPSTFPTASARTTAAPTSPRSPSPSPILTPELVGAELARRVDAESMLPHLEALEQIALRDPPAEGNRATRTIGYQRSLRYVVRTLQSNHYLVETQGLDGGESAIAVRGGTGEGVIVIGAHLDSVAAGPGINDNGSGVAALLALADQIRFLPRTERTIKFAFWGAEEGGPFGSAAYVASLEPEELAEIDAYLNVDMISSPNAIRFVYAEADAALGSERLTEAFAAYFDAEGLPWAPIDLEGDSDHGPFIAAGIPTGGLFSGGIEPVTAEQAALFGAVAGEPADPCSHRACDTLANVDLATLDEMADAIANVLVALATEAD